MASSSMESVDFLGKRMREDDLEIEPIRKRQKGKSEVKECKEAFAAIMELIKRSVESLETKSDQANLISVKEASVPEKTLFVDNLTDNIRIIDIINFFKDVGKVARVRLVVTNKGKRVGCGFVEFASAKDAKKALQKKNCEYLHDRKIILDVANNGATYRPPKYCIDHRVRYKDYLRRESLPIEEGKTSPDSVEAVLFVANLSPQTTKMSDIIDFLGDVVSVRLIVNHEGRHVGCGFVEFASPNEAKEAQEKKNAKYLHGHKILLMKRLAKTPDLVEALAVRNKTLFFAHFPSNFRISDIINFFRDVGEVVHVRLTVDREGKHLCRGLVEFASSSEAKKALEKKNGEYFKDRKIFLDAVKTGKDQFRPKFCIDHKVWYEDYLRRERLLIEEDAALEEIAVRKKTLFVANLSPGTTKISDIIAFFGDVGEVVGVRLIVDECGRHVGCGFVEFASAKEAKKALEEKYFVSCEFFLDVALIAPYLYRPNCKLADKLWYDYNLRVENLDLGTEPDLEEHNEIFCGKKTTFDD